MKKALLFSYFILMSMIICHAQIITPGTGERYTFADMLSDPSGFVTSTQPGCYAVHQSLTLSGNDTLVLDPSVTRISFDGNTTVTVRGVIVCATRDSLLQITGMRADSLQDYVTFRFDSTQTAGLSGLWFNRCKSITLSNSNLTFDNCEFSNFTDIAVKYLSCNPTIQNCYFHHNESSAIGSAVNLMGSPRILNSRFFNNVLNNSNRAQINLGPGAADTIIIAGNHIEGVASYQSGGIGISNLLTTTGTTNMIVRDNTIVHNRYGYTQIGYDIHTEIEGNTFSENDLEPSPNNGGSGISITGYSNTCTARIRHNLIYGNLWGVTVIGAPTIDMGTAEDPGGNVIFDNGNSGITYALYNNSSLDFYAVSNYWGTNSDTEAETVIFHKTDYATLGQVFYQPIMTIDPVVLSCYAFEEADSDTHYDGILTAADSSTFTIAVPQLSTPLSDLIIVLDLPFGATDSLLEDIVDNTPEQSIRTLRYSVSTPHHDTREWTVRIESEGTSAVTNHDSEIILLYPNPMQGNTFTICGQSNRITKAEVYNALGQRVYVIDGDYETLTVPTSGWPAGLYIVKATQGKKLTTLRIVKTR